MKSRGVLRIVGAVGLACVISTGAFAQAQNEVVEEEIAPGDLVGMVIVGNVSVPVVRGGRVRHYEYGTVGLAVEDTRKYLDDIYENRFELADAFLVYLHSNPFAQGGAADGPEASKSLLVWPRKSSGPTSSPRSMWCGASPPKVCGQCQRILGTHCSSLPRQLAAQVCAHCDGRGATGQDRPVHL